MTDYYVSTSGNNSNDGLSEGNAFRDVEYAVNYASLSPGDTVHVKTGTFYEEVLINTRSGSSGNPITLVATDGEGTVTISGLQNASGEDPYYPRGTFAPDTTDTISAGTGLGYVYNGLVRFVSVSHWVIDGFNVNDSRGRGCQVHNSSHITWKNISVDGSRNSCWHAQNSNNIVFEDSAVTDGCNFAPFNRSSGDIDWPVVVNMINCQGVRVQRVDISRSWGEGISTGRDSEDVEILDNRIKDCYALLAYMHRSKNVRFERNILFHTTIDTFNRGGAPSRCLVINAEGQFPDSSAPENISIRNNLIIARTAGISFWNNGGGAAQSGYVEVVNNTVVAASGGYAVHSFTSGSTYTDTKVYNNIFYAVDGAAYDTGESTITQNFTWDSNYWSASPPRLRAKRRR